MTGMNLSKEKYAFIKGDPLSLKLIVSSPAAIQNSRIIGGLWFCPIPERK